MTSAPSPQTCPGGLLDAHGCGALLAAAQCCMVPARPPMNVLLILMAPGALRVTLLHGLLVVVLLLWLLAATIPGIWMGCQVYGVIGLPGARLRTREK